MINGTNSSLTTSELSLLFKQAHEAQQSAYAPYSSYCVGAALMTDEGAIFKGANVENASYGLGNCAERSAIYSAVSQGKRCFKAMVIITRDGGFPCGACRQVLNEFNFNFPLYIYNEKGELRASLILSEILPKAFGPHNVLDTIS